MIDKQIYERSADAIPNWRDIDKNELCRLYCANENNPCGEAYLSALICKYWNNIYKYYNQSQGYATLEDCYDIVIDAIQNIIRRRPWEDEKSNLYGDKNAPDKAINRCIKTTWINSYIASMRDKRLCNTNNLHLESLDAPVVDAIEYACADDVDTKDDDVMLSNLVRCLYNSGDYLGAFCADLIVHGNVFARDDGMSVFSDKKLIKYLHHITDNYIRVFSEEYNLPYDKVKKSAEYIVNQSTNSLREGIRISLDAMRKYFPNRDFSVIDETSDDFWGV